MAGTLGRCPASQAVGRFCDGLRRVPHGIGKPILPGRKLKPMSCAIAVMAKAPRAGQSKTRLTPPLSQEAARDMSAAFLHDITTNIQLAARHADIVGYVAHTPAGLEHLFNGLLAPGTKMVLADGGGDMPDGVEGLGRSLLHATRSLFALGHSAVCLVNSDSPTLPTACLVRAAQVLAEGTPHVVLGPTEDGGYYLIGMSAVHEQLFAGIAWSTDLVVDQTRVAAAAIGLPPMELPGWYDVDDRAALARLIADLDAGAGFNAPATTACIARLGLRERLGV